MSAANEPPTNAQTKTEKINAKWYSGVTRYQWLILLIASAGWVFDVYEGQIFNITRDQMLADILKVPTNHPSILDWGDKFLGIFLLGGTLGGILFGSLADKWGRRPTMILTILFYSVFSGLTFFATELWHVAALRFLVAVGVGGEWAVAAALVSEVFPTKARAHASGIFHATSVLGTWLATLAGWLVATEWRYAYLVGVAPALLILWVRASVKEPETWKEAGQKAAAGGARMGSLRDLLGNPLWNKRALLGMLLAAVGLGSFWGVTVAGQGIAKAMLIKEGVDPQQAMQKAKIAYGFIQTLGGGIGLLAFGPMCAWLGRKKAFVLMHILAFVIVPITCYAPQNYTQLLILLPIFGFLTLGMHAGYAIYFPELFPSHLRATGTGFCFNGGRILAASMLVLSAKLKANMDFHQAITILGCSFLLGLIVIAFLPETKDKPLPE